MSEFDPPPKKNNTFDPFLVSTESVPDNRHFLWEFINPAPAKTWAYVQKLIRKSARGR